jgi:hypothetical protein
VVDVNPNVLKWVEALESDEYHQTKGFPTHKAEDGSASHCCLGVACTLAVADGVPVESRGWRWPTSLRRTEVSIRPTLFVIG